MTRIGRQCVILVGGLGSRLGALTADCPKPLLSVAGQPFLSHLMTNAMRFGFDQFVLLAGFKSDLVEQYAQKFSSDHAVGVAISVEDSPAGTAGALVPARNLLADEFLLLNGDTLFDFNLLDLAVRAAAEPWTGRIALRRIADTSRYGRVECAGDRIVSLSEKTPGLSGGLINAGAYWLSRSILDQIRTSPLSLEHDVFPALVEQRALLGFEYDGPFIDIGVPDDLEFAQSRWREFLLRPATIFDRDGVLNVDAGYTHRIEDFRWIDGAIEAIKLANDAGRYVFVVTNQAGIARGYYDRADVDALHHWMNEDLRPHGAHIDDFRYCPHHPEGTVAALGITCECRKPKPGMINSLLAEWAVDRNETILIGDKPSDIAAATAAGIRGFLFDGSNFDWRS